MKTMNALVYTGKEDMQFCIQPFPQAGPGESLVRIDAVGICGSDMHAYHGHDPRRVPPLILGHEATGVVEQGRFKGQRVTMNPIAFCGQCRYCLEGRQNLCANRTMIGMSRPGAFAQYVAIPDQCLIALPDDFAPAHAAVTEPAATAVHAVDLAARACHGSLAGQRALILGAGAIGLLIALVLRHMGCSTIHIGDTNPLRRQGAGSVPGLSVFDPGATVPDADQFDLVFDAVGANGTRSVAIDAVAPGGVIVHVGLLQGEGPVNVRKLTLAEITFIGAYTYSQRDLQRAAALLYEGALGDLFWVDVRPLSQGVQAFSELHKGQAAAAKIVLQPW
jgi:alcohol dehydrogenase